MTLSAHPPRIGLTIRIGVTGHRPDKLDAPPGHLAAEVAAVFGTLRTMADSLRDTIPDAYDGGRPVLRVVSALAEGADRLVAQAGLDAGATLHAVLPFPRTEYQADFPDPASSAAFHTLLDRAAAVLEYDGRRSDSPGAYEAAGLGILQQSDALIAIWNGKPAEGRGGTADIVGQAVARGLPVIWIDSLGRRPTGLLTADGGGDHTVAPLPGLRDRLATVVVPPTPAAGPHGEKGADLRRTYFTEAPPGRSWGGLFTAFAALVVSGKPRGLLGGAGFDPQASVEAWRQELAAVPGLPPPVPRFVLDGLALHHGWADALATHYAGLHRSSFLVNYLLGAVAVFLALLGVAVPAWANAGTVAELVVIILIVANTAIGQRRCWHQRWIDYRQLAEHLRYLRFLAPLGLSAPDIRAPAHLGAPESGKDWVAWLLRAIVRQLGVPPVQMGEAHREAMRRLLLDGELMPQISYHQNNAARMKILDHRLHIGGNVLFTVTFLACAAHLAVDHHAALAGWLTLVAAAGPATGAALYGIRNHGECARVAQRSAAMTKELTVLADALQKTPVAPAGVEETARRAAEIMGAETLDWRFVFRGKPLILPV